MENLKIRTFGDLIAGDRVGVDLGSHYEVWEVKSVKDWKNSVGNTIINNQTGKEEEDNRINHVLIEFTNEEKQVFLKNNNTAGSMMKKFISDKKDFERKLKFEINKLYGLIEEMENEEDTVF